MVALVIPAIAVVILTGGEQLFLVELTIVALLKMWVSCADISSLLYRNYYQLKYSWNFLKKVKWLSDIRQPFFDLLR